MSLLMKSLSNCIKYYPSLHNCIKELFADFFSLAHSIIIIIASPLRNATPTAAMGSKRGGKNVISTAGKTPSTTSSKEADDAEEFISEEEYRKKFEPVAPWKRKNIPDYGPLRDQQHVLIFIAIGIVATLFYELTRCVQHTQEVVVMCV